MFFCYGIGSSFSGQGGMILSFEIGRFQLILEK
jgi:hypothetical protein